MSPFIVGDTESSPEERTEAPVKQRQERNEVGSFNFVVIHSFIQIFSKFLPSTVLGDECTPVNKTLKTFALWSLHF